LILHSYQQCISVPSPPVSSPEFVVCFLDDNHSDYCEMESHFSFDLYCLYG
jgi:hypothetical protein